MHTEQEQGGEVSELMGRIGDGLKTIAADEMKLARLELVDEVKKPLASAGAIILSGVIAIVGIGFLCATAVAALEPLIPALWSRLLIMSVAYIALGRVVMRLYVKKLAVDPTPDTPRSVQEAKRTYQAVKEELTHDGS